MKKFFRGLIYLVLLLVSLPLAAALYLEAFDFFTSVSSAKMSAENVFAPIDYDKVIAYEYSGEFEAEIIDKSGQLAPGISKQVQLTPPQVTELTNILCNKETYGGNVANCFNPHFGVVFYKNGIPKAHVSVCLECQVVESSVAIPSDSSGISFEGNQRIVGFENRIGF